MIVHYNTNQLLGTCVFDIRKRHHYESTTVYTFCLLLIDTWSTCCHSYTQFNLSMIIPTLVTMKSSIKVSGSRDEDSFKVVEQCSDLHAYVMNVCIASWFCYMHMGHHYHNTNKSFKCQHKIQQDKLAPKVICNQIAYHVLVFHIRFVNTYKQITCLNTMTSDYFCTSR